MAFKQDILNKIIGAAQVYKSVFMDFDYLVFSGDFPKTIPSLPLSRTIRE